MTRIKRNHSTTFKAQVALTACMGHKALAELAEHFGVHPTRSQGKAESAEAGRRRTLMLRDLLRLEGHLIERRHVSTGCHRLVYRKPYSSQRHPGHPA